MGVESSIQWTEATWNPWHGCRKVSPGCKYCYMYRDKDRYGQDPTTVLRSKNNFNQPLKMKEPALIFTCSWSDWFIEEADAWRDEAWAIIKATPQHTYQILTKRPERIRHCLPADWGEGYPNVWLGTSVEDQEQANKRIPHLLMNDAVVHFVSAEPLLRPVDLTKVEVNGLDLFGIGLTPEEKQDGPVETVNVLDYESILPNMIDWVIIGGESGNHSGKWLYRACELDWITDLIWQCNGNRTAVFVKQLGTQLAKDMHLSDRHGGNIEEWPLHLQVREMPAIGVAH